MLQGGLNASLNIFAKVNTFAKGILEELELEAAGPGCSGLASGGTGPASGLFWWPSGAFTSWPSSDTQFSASEGIPYRESGPLPSDPVSSAEFSEEKSIVFRWSSSSLTSISS